MNYVDKIKGFLGKFSSKTKKIVVGALALAIIFSVVLAVVLNNKPYKTLFTGLNEQEASEVMGKLQESGVEYQYDSGTIMVPQDSVDKMKAMLAYEGYPRKGFTYDIFKDNISLMTTDFEKRNYKLFELQDRIGSTIRLFDGVKEAVVTIALGEDKKYALSSTDIEQASAAVTVVMNDNGSPTPQQVAGIQRLISKSIPQMEIENVVVLDGNGNDVSVSQENDKSGSNKEKIQAEKEIEDIVKANVLNVLVPFYGVDNVKVSVKSKIDMEAKIKESISYSAPPNLEDKTGIPSSQTTVEESSTGTEEVGGVPGADANADIPTYNNGTNGGTNSYTKTESATDFLVDSLKEQGQLEPGTTLQDLTVAVSINGVEGEAPRNLQMLVGDAAGIIRDVQTDKITLTFGTFYVKPGIAPPIGGGGGLTLQVWQIALIAGLVLFLFLFMLLGGKRKKKKRGALQAGGIPLNQAALAGANSVTTEMIQVQNEKGMELKNNIRDFAEQNPEISAQLLKSWLRGGDKGGS